MYDRKVAYIDVSRAVDFKIRCFFKSESNDSTCLKSHDKIILF